MIVLDASAAIEWLLQTPKAPSVEARLVSGNGTSQGWHAPCLLDLEVAQVVRRHVAANMISASYGRQALDNLIALPLVRHPHDALLPRVWELRQNLTAYDAAYVALAEALDAPLVTCDRHIANAPGHHARVDVI